MKIVTVANKYNNEICIYGIETCKHKKETQTGRQLRKAREYVENWNATNEKKIENGIKNEYSGGVRTYPNYGIFDVEESKPVEKEMSIREKYKANIDRKIAMQIIDMQISVLKNDIAKYGHCKDFVENCEYEIEILERNKARLFEN